MPTLTQNLTQTITDVITLPFHLTLFFVLAPFRFARWGVRTGRNWIHYFFGLLVYARNDLTQRLEAAKQTKKQQKSQIGSKTPLPTLASLPQKEASPEPKRPASPSPYDDFLDHMRQELKSSKDPKARVQTLKKMLEASQDNAIEATSFASEQQGKMHEMEVQYEDLHKELCNMSFKLEQATEDYTTEHRKRIELQSKCERLQEALDAERKSHKDALQGDRVLLMKMEKDLIEERKKNVETKQAYQMANLELTELVIREEQRKREIVKEAKQEKVADLKEQIAREEEIVKHLASDLHQKPSETSVSAPADDAKPAEESKDSELPHHEFDPNHFSYKDAILENAQPVHHDFDTHKFSFKDALLEPAFEEPLHESQAPDAQSSF